MAEACVGVGLLALFTAVALSALIGHESADRTPPLDGAELAMTLLTPRSLEVETLPAAESLLHGQRPRLFQTSPATTLKLPCMRWNVTSLRRRGGDIWLSAFASERDPLGSAEFVLARGREAEFERSEPVTVLPNVSLAELLTPHANRLSATQWRPALGSPSRLTYHAGAIGSWGAELSAEALGLQAAFDTLDVPAQTAAENWPPSAINAWLGSRGVLATPHYDPSHNVGIRLLGC